MKRWLLPAVLLSAAQASAARSSWPQSSIDPHKLADDLVLPLPCGGAMVFRPVDVPAGRGPLDDRAIEDGRADNEDGYSEYQHQAWLASPFAVPNAPGTRRYYMGKYDVTRDQFASLQGSACAPPSSAGRLPEAKVSWTEAVDFASAWSSWLLAHARDRLPKRGSSFGFVRLPTDDEWSYAARGGARVSESDFLAPTWPMPEGIDHYVMAGPDIAAGSAHAVGSMLPNPLGLYDMLGEVSQMMVEPFRLNRVGRPHGQAGGLLVRGGDYTFNPDDLRTSLRIEIPPYDPATGAPTRLATMGFRLVVSADALGDMKETEAAQAQFDALDGQKTRLSGSPRQLLEAIRTASSDAAIRDALARVDAALASDERERDDAAATALSAEIEAAAALAMNIWDLENRIGLLKQFTDSSSVLDPAQRAKVQHNLDSLTRLLPGSADGYLDLLRAVGASLAAGRLHDTVALERTAMTERGETNLPVFLSLVEADTKAQASGHPPDRDTTLARIGAISHAAARGG